jgi:hypothetical protein
MPLSPRNLLPSVSRLHFHLQNANCVLQQAYAEACELDPFVIQASADDFTDWAMAALDVTERRAIAEGARERFRAEMPLASWFGPMVEAVLDGIPSQPARTAAFAEPLTT